MIYAHVYGVVVGTLCCLWQVEGFPFNGYATISHDGPVVLGGTITFRADLYKRDGSRPSGNFSYEWTDNTLSPNHYETESTTNTTTFWSVSYSANKYSVGPYRMQVVVKKKWFFVWYEITSERTTFDITLLLNGNVTIQQSNKTIESNYLSSKYKSTIKVNIRKGDYDYIVSNATAISTFWFVDCKYYGQTNDFTFNYTFSTPNVTSVIEALVIASHDPPVTTTLAPTTTVAPNTSTPTLNTTTVALNTTTSITPTTTISTTTTTVAPILNINATVLPFENVSFPFVCLNSSLIPPNPKKTYGYFHREVKIRAPISNITVKGTNWLQPWEMLSLNVSCNGTGPFNKCLIFLSGQYNVTGNETCKETDHLDSCEFLITHYFLDPSVYTILVVLGNDIGTQVYPVTINIYKVTPKPQLSVIVVPVSCSLAAVVLIVFGVAYYIQSRARFTVEVADFDFAQNNPEMEYKTFTERLRDSFNNAVRPGGDRINRYEPLSNPLLK